MAETPVSSKFSDRVIQTFTEISEGVVRRAEEVETMHPESRCLILTPEGIRKIKASEISGKPGPPGPANLANDPNPTLAADLNLNSHSVVGQLKEETLVIDGGLL